MATPRGTRRDGTKIAKKKSGARARTRGTTKRERAFLKPKGELEAALSDEDIVATVKQYLRLNWESMEVWFEEEMRPKYKGVLKRRISYGKIRSLAQYYAPAYVGERRKRLVEMMLGVEQDIADEPINWLKVAMDCLEQKMTTLSALDVDELSEEDLATIGDIGKIVLKFRDQEIRREGLELYRDRLRAQITTKVQAGLDQLYKEIKDNPKALAAFEKMRNLLAEGINSDVEEAPYTKPPKVVGSGRKPKTPKAKGGKA